MALENTETLAPEALAIDGGTPVRTKPFISWPMWDKDEEEGLLRVLHSGKWGWEGDETTKFEEEWGFAHQARFVFTVPSGSAALETALFAAGVGLGDEVIVPPYTFYATGSSCLMRGAIPVFADIEATSFNFDAADAERKITPRTKAIIPVHIAGCPADLDAARALAERHGLACIEDAAQAHGAHWRGRPVGAIGDLGCFSFQSSKNLSGGEGGIVTTDSEELADLCFNFKTYGRDRVNMVWNQHDTLGTNFRMTQFQAAVLRAQLQHLEEWSEKRAQNGAYLGDRLRELGGLTPQQPPAGVTRPAYHVFMTRYDAEQFGGRDRDWFCESLAAEGIPCTSGYRPLYESAGIHQTTRQLLQTLGREVNEEALGWKTCPVVEELCGQSVWMVGQSALLGTQDDMDDIVRAVAKVKRAATA